MKRWLMSREVFGGKGTFDIWWLLPTNPVLLDRSDILGYEVETKEVSILIKQEDWIVMNQNEHPVE